jgi:saccharopine dehydrogenase (NAD+, L-lysine-forming)
LADEAPTSSILPVGLAGGEEAHMWMLYGANGYTGQLTAELARERGLVPILAGRSAEKVVPLAERLGLEHRVFDLDAPGAALDGVRAVVHMAGPFSTTSRPMVDACLAAGAHYLDITGEIGVFEAVASRDAEARARGVALIPGVGFDVVPTDCLAAMLKAALPDATHLDLAFATIGSGPSKGTAMTAVEGLAQGSGAARIDGRIRPVPVAWRTREVPFADRERHVVSIPWGDVSTAFHSTGIPNVTTFLAMSPRTSARLRRLAPLRGLLRVGPLQRAAKAWAARRFPGPDDATRASARTELWGEAWNARGRVSRALTTPDGYTLTADASLRAVERVLAGVEPGFHTPSRAFGFDFVAGLEGVKVHPERTSGLA